MPRNKFPEETKNRIMESANRLFVEKGYEKTTVQDIIDDTKLSKGAIYHHFASKESILLGVYSQIGERTALAMRKIMGNEKLNGAQKLAAMFTFSYEDKDHTDFMVYLPNLLNNPSFLVLHMQNTINEVVPKYVYPVIMEGIRDGSLKCECPLETAHAVVCLSNVWMNPLIYSDTRESVQNKVTVYSKILKAVGIEAINTDFYKKMSEIVTSEKEK